MARNDEAWSAEILARLDEALEEFTLPEPANVNYPMAYGEILAFRSADEWLLAYQLVCFAKKDHEFVVNVHAFGNKIDKLGLQSSTEVVRMANGDSCWSEGDDEDVFEIDLHNFAVRVRERPVEFSPGRAEYEAAGIDLDTMKPPLAFLRFLTHAVPDAFLLSPDELLRQLGKTDLRLLFRLTEWQQPDFTEDELPSTIPCFQAIAASVAAGEPMGIDVCAANANSHWSQWQEFE